MSAFRIFSTFAELLDVKVTRAAAAWLRLNTDGTVSERTAAQTLADIGAQPAFMGPFPGDTEAGANSVPVGEPYLQTDGLLKWRQEEPAASSYEDETLEYMALSGADPSIEAALDAWIKGLKNLEAGGAAGAWSGASMWIFRSAYHAPGEVIHGLGGNPKIAQVEFGSRQVTRSTSEFLFEGAGARIRIPGVNLLPVSPPLSVMMVSRDPLSYQNYGAGFGGERGTLHFVVYGVWSLTNSVSRNHLSFPGTAPSTESPATPSETRSVKLMSVTGQRAGSVSINGGTVVAAGALGDDYSLSARSVDTTVAGNPTFGSPAASACSFSCIWQTSQAANTAAIYALYKSTIGLGLGLP
jgi:hypothetical protein